MRFALAFTCAVFVYGPNKHSVTRVLLLPAWTYLDAVMLQWHCLSVGSLLWCVRSVRHVHTHTQYIHTKEHTIHTKPFICLYLPWFSLNKFTKKQWPPVKYSRQRLKDDEHTQCLFMLLLHHTGQYIEKMLLVGRLIYTNTKHEDDGLHLQ